MRKTNKIIKDIEFPFLIIHDPEDKITLFEGSKSMMDNTIKVQGDNKKLIGVKGALHDIVPNEFSVCVNLIIDYVIKEMRK